MNERERMLAGLPYHADRGGLPEERLEARKILHAFNSLPPDHSEEAETLLRRLLGRCGARIKIEPPFHCDYGSNVEMGDNLFANFNLVILDGCRVILGKNVQIGPNVTLCTAAHPVCADLRDAGWEFSSGITVGDSVWIGAGVCVLPGVRIGSRTVIGAGSVVTRDLPADVVAVGNPCRVLRPVTQEDRQAFLERLPQEDRA